uniref:Reverse transcriptase zinc-binding domain-containing protein n=1 Tax=Cannabis sativa TaxID=3483 RepID=A0A803NJN4_CANSA
MHRPLHVRPLGFELTGLGACPSLTWRSIVWGKELLVKCLRWRVGTGSRINCKMDSWLPGHTDFTPFSFIGADSSLQADIDRILSIPLSIFPTEDVLIWNGNNSGNYTVKSGYHFAAFVADLQDASSTNNFEKWWTKFWKLKLPTKLRIFVWKVFHNALPVAAELK